MWVDAEQIIRWVEALERGDSLSVGLELAVAAGRWACGQIEPAERAPDESYSARFRRVSCEASRTLRALLPEGTTFVLVMADVHEAAAARVHVCSPLEPRDMHMVLDCARGLPASAVPDRQAQN